MMKTLVSVIAALTGLACHVHAQDQLELQQQQQQPQYDCVYTEPIELENWGEGTVMMEYYSNLQAEPQTITMRIAYLDGDDAWVGIGINTDDDHHMTNSWAVIGDANRGVKRYWMASEARDASGVWELDDVHGQLTGASFVQEDGQSILEFTMDIVIKDEDDAATVDHIISPASHWIWGVGRSGNRWQGIHRELGFFDGLPIFEGCTLAATETIVPPPPPPEVVDPVDVENSDMDEEEENENVFEEEQDVEDEGSSSEVDVEVEGDEESGNNSDSQSPSAGSQINFGSSSSKQQEDSGVVRGMWVAHGISLALAWGVFAPLAVGAAYLKKMNILSKDARWLNIHFYLGLACCSFTIFGFILAVMAANREGEETHFKKDTHHKAGLTIFILVLVQGVAGQFRPSNAPAPSSSSHQKAEADGTNDGMDPPSDHENTLNDTVEFDDGEKSDVSPPPPPPSSPTSATATTQPTKIRQFWEYFHRFLGITLLGLAWYNCTTGIVLQSEKYEEDDQQMLTNIFWGITGSIAASIFFVGYVLRLQ
eukprot:CAMPEP_0113512676 /NCGR_PEP_ID=MMETSP0014_2-20120614/39461_1 /TAXON_ID=2857 /ORGANISM="Nitzschia sp." /LENGTH=537 /DNA_ID=CAMNT_0000409039 /DNA_START=181 /DNA_END=1797 /DNA_ORIENTATION=+ /assembly_acc=CAM_ASM_000159